MSQLVDTINRLPESVRVLAWREVTTTDGLIGSWKCRHLGEVIEQPLEYSDRYGEPLVLALVLCDTEPFKAINVRKDHPTR